jgi:hypothetical protein
MSAFFRAIAIAAIYVHNKTSVLLDQHSMAKDLLFVKNRATHHLCPIGCVAYNNESENNKKHARGDTINLVEDDLQTKVTYYTIHLNIV